MLATELLFEQRRHFRAGTFLSEQRRHFRGHPRPCSPSDGACRRRHAAAAAAVLLLHRWHRAGEGTQPQRLLYSYFTAGTGGVGPTILETSLLLAGEPTVAYKDGKKYVLPPISERRAVDYGPGLGRRDAWLYNLPEVRTGFEVLGVPSVSARFGTSPAIWNLGMWVTARLAPKVRAQHVASA